MEKLSLLRVPPEWESALIACLDDPPRRPRPGCRLTWIASLVLALAGIAGIAAWYAR